MALLTISNAKTVKGEALGYLTGILYMAPSTLSGKNLCPNATEGCKEACLNTAGRGAFSNVQRARMRKAVLFNTNFEAFFIELIADIERLIKSAKRLNLVPVIRLNGTTDIIWESLKFNNKTIFEYFPAVQFYDYTKAPSRHRYNRFKNYNLTYSLNENNRKRVRGINCTVVVRNNQVKEKFKAVYREQFVDGDAHDLRFLDGQNKLIVLTAKGKAKKDQSGFVIG